MLNKIDALKLIKSIGTRGKGLDKDIQVACITAVFYSICNGDITIGQKLLAILNAGTRSAAVIGFLEHFGQFEYKSKSLVYRRNDKLFLMHELEQEVEAYCNEIKVHWTSFKPESIASMFDCRDKTKAFISSMEKAIKSGKALHSEVYDVMAKAYNEWLEAQPEDADSSNDEQQGNEEASLRKVVNL